MKKSKYRKIKLLSLVLTIIMLTYVMPFQTIAASEDIVPGQEPDASAKTFEITDPTRDWQGLPINSIQSSGIGNSLSINSTNSTTGELAIGVYSFRNVAHSDMWFDTRADSYNAGTYIQQYKYTTNPADTNYFGRSGLFKITKHQTYGTYVIRSMLNNRYTLKVCEDSSSGNKYIYTQEIPLNDGDVNINDTFEIEYNSNLGGYTVKRYGTNDYITSCSATASGGAGGMASCLQFTSSATTSSAWTVTKYTGSFRGGYVFEEIEPWENFGLVQDTFYNPRLITWCTQPNYNTPYVIPTYGYDDIVDWIWNPDSARFSITPRFPGPLNLNVGVALSSEDSYITLQSLTIENLTYRIVPQEGAYYVQNAGTEKYIDIEGLDAVAGAQVIQYQYFFGDSQMMWEIEHVSGSGGYVRIKSAAADIYLGINPSDPYDIILTEEQDDLSLWAIEVTQRKTLVFKCYDTEYSNLVMSVPNTTNHAAIVQTTYVNNSTDIKDEWHLVKKVISMVNWFDTTFTAYDQDIPTAVSFANAVYARYFGVGIFMDGNATQRLDTIADQCERYEFNEETNTMEIVACNNSCNSVCLDIDLANSGEYEHLSECGHHKNVTLMFWQMLNQSRESDHIYVLWTNRPPNTYCTYKYSSVLDRSIHTPTSALAMSFQPNDNTYIPVILFLRVEENGGTTEEETTAILQSSMTLALVHEIAHFLGSPEVYDNDGHDQLGKCVCVMERFELSMASPTYYQNLLNGYAKPFCQSCEETMRSAAIEYIT